MSLSFESTRSRLGLLIAGMVMLLSGCERPPMESVQHGYRGTGMVQVYNPRALELQVQANEIPPGMPPMDASGPKASQLYKNVKVLGDLSGAQFTRIMTSMTTWVSPQEGCLYCHNPANFADDSKYTKVVARRMLQMTQHINSDWKQHVAETGVTCYTCHRGQPVPSAIWFKSNPQPYGSNFMGDKAGQNHPAPSVALSSLPNDPFTHLPAGGQQHPGERAHGTAFGQPPIHQAGGVDVRAHDAHVLSPGGQLHLLPQLALLPNLGR